MAASEESKIQRLNKFIQALMNQGILEENFSSRLQGNNNLYQIRNTVVSFFTNTESNLENVNKFLRKPNPEFPIAVTTMEQLKSHAARIGGKRFAEACEELEQICRDCDARRCIEAYKKVSREYYLLRDCFQHILQAERKIYPSTQSTEDTN